MQILQKSASESTRSEKIELSIHIDARDGLSPEVKEILDDMKNTMCIDVNMREGDYLEVNYNVNIQYLQQGGKTIAIDH